MQILKPELVAKASELPSLVLVLTAALGPMLWVLGWRVHRTMFVMAATVVGGMYGLVYGEDLGLHRWLAAALLSISAGGLATSSLSIATFVVFGALADWVVNSLILSHMDDQIQQGIRVTVFLLAGLVSLFHFRFLVIITTSFAGSFLFLLGGMAFAARQGEVDTIGLAAEQSAIVSTVFIVLGLLGTAGQYVLEKHRVKEKRDRTRDPASDLLRRMLKPKPSS